LGIAVARRHILAGKCEFIWDVRATTPEQAPAGVLSSADRSCLAFVGMSFGGATSATACKAVTCPRA